jgi:hypothetical protein
VTDRTRGNVDDPQTADGMHGTDGVYDFARLRAREFGYLDGGGHIYLDHTGAGLPPRSLVTGSAQQISGALFGNPHSESPAPAHRARCWLGLSSQPGDVDAFVRFVDETYRDRAPGAAGVAVRQGC